MVRKGRMDMATVTAIILAVLVIAIVSVIVFKISGSGEEKSDDIVDALACTPKIAQACIDNKITESGGIDEVDGTCITDQNKATICDTI
ncbi:MAG: hypothetical protein KAR51_02165 [Candidatus Aenigmarchaeota archaeon]|nr:hypothetical protein [Candidatus Aenigmarchaeota archaeon]